VAAPKAVMNQVNRVASKVWMTGFRFEKASKMGGIYLLTL
jgi:hypothetical protein